MYMIKVKFHQEPDFVWLTEAGQPVVLISEHYVKEAVDQLKRGEDFGDLDVFDDFDIERIVSVELGREQDWPVPPVE